MEHVDAPEGHSRERFRKKSRVPLEIQVLLSLLIWHLRRARPATMAEQAWMDWRHWVREHGEEVVDILHPGRK